MNSASTPVLVEELRHLLAHRRVGARVGRAERPGRDRQSGVVRPGHQLRPLLDDRFVRPDAGGPGGDLAELVRRIEPRGREGSTRNTRGTRGRSLASCLRVVSSNDWMITGVCASATSPFFSSTPASSDARADAALAVERRILQLGIEAGLAPHEIDRFLEGRDPLAREFPVEPGAGVEPLDLGEREVVHEPAARGAAGPVLSSTKRSGNTSSTLVVRSSVRSWMHTRTPSFVTARSCSTKSAFCAMARR